MGIARGPLLLPAHARPDRRRNPVVEHIGSIPQQPAHKHRILLRDVVIDAAEGPVSFV